MMVHGEACAREEVQKAMVLYITYQFSLVGESGRVCHVNGDCVSVAKRSFGNELMER